jgi:hypothetical protein
VINSTKMRKSDRPQIVTRGGTCSSENDSASHASAVYGSLRSGVLDLKRAQGCGHVMLAAFFLVGIQALVEYKPA